MGSTKVKTIDDSKETVEKKPKSSKDPLVDLLNQSLGIVATEPKKASVKVAAVAATGQQAEKYEAGTKLRSKRYLKSLGSIDRTKNYNIAEAVEAVKATSYTKFPGSVELHINTNVKNIRGLANLPFMSGKKLMVLAFGQGAKEAGADIVGDDGVLDKIAQGKMNFDILVTTPEWMPRIAPLARILGPKGLMPNPKNGTITDNLNKVIAELRKGKVEYKTEPNGQVVHMAVGQVTQPSEEVIANIKGLYFAIGKSKVSKMVIAPTMGPGVKVNLGSF